MKRSQCSTSKTPSHASEGLVDGMGLDADLFHVEPIYIGKREHSGPLQPTKHDIPPGSVDAIGLDDESFARNPLVLRCTRDPEDEEPPNPDTND